MFYLYYLQYKFIHSIVSINLNINKLLKMLHVENGLWIHHLEKKSDLESIHGHILVLNLIRVLNEINTLSLTISRDLKKHNISYEFSKKKLN